MDEGVSSNLRSSTCGLGRPGVEYGDVGGSFEQFPLVEHRAGPHERNQIWCVDRASTRLRGVDQLVAIANPAAREPGPLVTFVRNRTVAKVDSMGFVVRRCTQCSAGYL